MENRKSYIGIKNSLSEDSTLELFFTDFIFDGFDWNTWEETNLVQDTIDKITAAKPSKILVTINSLGGDVMIGLAIYNFLKSYNAEVEVDIIGFAASIASIMAMSASKGKLRIAKNGFMIIHAASSGMYGNAKEMKGQAAVLDKITGEMADIYALRSGKDAKHFTDLWADGGDVWLTGSEAKAMGLADELLNAVPMTATINLEAYGFKKIPNKITSSLIQTKKNMAFEKTLATAKAESFKVVDGGFLLEETALNNLEATIAASETTAAELATAKEKETELTEAVATEKKTVETLTAASVTHAEKIKELEAKVEALGKKPSGTGSSLNSKKDETVEEQSGKIGLNSADHPLNQYARTRLAAKNLK